MNDIQDMTPATITQVTPTVKPITTAAPISTTELTITTLMSEDTTTNNRERSTPAAGFQEDFSFIA